MIDLTQYEELTKVYKQAQNLERECEKEVNKEKRIDFDKAMENYDKIYEPYMQYKYDVLAREVFKALTKLNPILVEHRTGKRLSFVEIFGGDFNKLSKTMINNLLMLTREKSIVYKFEDDAKLLNGSFDHGGDYSWQNKIGFESSIWRNGEEVDCGYQYGMPKNMRDKLSYDDKVKNDEKFESMSDRERAEYMNNNYGMKYKLKDI